MRISLIRHSSAGSNSFTLTRSWDMHHSQRCCDLTRTCSHRLDAPDEVGTSSGPQQRYTRDSSYYVPLWAHWRCSPLFAYQHCRKGRQSCYCPQRGGYNCLIANFMKQKQGLKWSGSRSDRLVMKNAVQIYLRLSPFNFRTSDSQCLTFRCALYCVSFAAASSISITERVGLWWHV